MKRVLVSIILCIYVFGIIGCTREPDVKKPPELRVEIGDHAIKAMQGSYSLNYPLLFGRWGGVEACGVHPMDSEIQLLPFMIEQTKLGELRQASFHFELEPDLVNVSYWSAEHFGNTEVPSQGLPLTEDGIELLDGSYVYEVFAKWYADKKWNGEAYYYFYVK